MNWIVAKKRISEEITEIVIKNNEIALSQKTGQYVNVQIDEYSEPVQLIISKANKFDGTISLLIHRKGKIQKQLAKLTAGDQVHNVAGPFGEKIKVDYTGTVICVADGTGIAALYPVVKAMKSTGNKVITIVGASTSEYLLLCNELERMSDELIIYTDDGSRGIKGLLTDGIMLVNKREKIEKIIAFGSSQMIKHTTLIIRQYNIPLVSILYSTRVDGIGMNAAYRVSVCVNSKYICVDGHNFNAFYTDFDTMINKMDCTLKKRNLGNQNYQLASCF